MFLGGNRVFLYHGKNSQGKYILRGGSELKIASGLDICSEKRHQNTVITTELESTLCSRPNYIGIGYCSIYPTARHLDKS